MLNLQKKSRAHQGRRYPRWARVKGYPERVAVIRRSYLTTRVAPLTNDGSAVAKWSGTVPTSDVIDEELNPSNLKQNYKDGHAGKSFPEVCRVKGLEAEGVKFIKEIGAVQSRLIDIDAKTGLSIGQSYTVPTETLVDRKSAPTLIRRRATMNDRGILAVPADLRAAVGLNGPCQVVLEQRSDDTVLLRLPKSGEFSGQEPEDED